MKSFFVLMLSLFAAQSWAHSKANVKCAVDICGSRDFLLNTQGVGSFREVRTDQVKALLKQSVPVMEEIMNSETQYNLMKVKALENFSTMFASDSMNDTDRAMLGMLAVSSLDFWDLDRTYVRMQDGKIKVHRPKFYQKLSGVDPEKRTWIADFFDALLNSPWSSVSSSIEGRPYEFALQVLGYDPSKSNELGQHLVATAMMNRPLLGKLATSDSEMEIFNKMAAGQELNAFEKNAAVSAISTVFSQQNVIDGEMREVLIKNPFTMNEILANGRSKLDSFKSILASPEKMKKARAEMINLCSSKIASSVAAAPTAEHIKIAMTIAESVKTSALAVVPRYVSGEALLAAQAALQKATFMPPQDRSTVIQNIEQYLQTAAKDARGQIAYQSSVDVQSMRADLMLKMLNIFSWEKTDGAASIAFKVLSDTCAEISPPTVTDAVLTTSGSIVMSWQSALWPGHGAGVMAHELGHVVEKAVNKEEDLKDTLTCQMKQHTLVYGAGASGSDQADEDFADNFSSTVMMHLQKRWPYTKNFGCLLLSADPEKKNLDVKALSLAEGPTSSHSVPFYRLLQVEASRGKLPPSCAKLPEIKGKAIGTCAL